MKSITKTPPTLLRHGTVKNKHQMDNRFTSRLQKYNWHRSKQLSLCLLVASLITGSVNANPTVPQVVNGTAAFDQIGNILNIANSNGAIINWQDFSIAQGELTRFLQQSGNSAVLNRVTGGSISEILGQLQSNGRVFLINTNGIVFGQSAMIDTNGFIASTLDISNNDFINNILQFKGGGGSLDNRGIIRVRGDGNIMLLAPNIKNSGIIQADNGQILLAAGRDIEISTAGIDNVTFRVQAPGDSVLNLGQIIAQRGAVGLLAADLNQQGSISISQQSDGRIFLEANNNLVGGELTAPGGSIDILGDTIEIAGSQISAASVNGGGKIRIGGDLQGGNGVRTAATTVITPGSNIDASGIGSANGGDVIIWSDVDTRVDGQVLARGGESGGNGGFVETSSKGNLDFSIPADVSAPNGNGGQWLLDPENINIDSGKAAGIESALNNGSNVTIATSEGGTGEGNISVNAPITKTEGDDASLSLIAHNRIDVNQPITSTSNKLHVNLRAGAKINIYGGINTNGGNLSSAITGVNVAAPPKKQPEVVEDKPDQAAEEPTKSGNPAVTKTGPPKLDTTADSVKPEVPEAEEQADATLVISSTLPQPPPPKSAEVVLPANQVAEVQEDIAIVDPIPNVGAEQMDLTPIDVPKEIKGPTIALPSAEVFPSVVSAISVNGDIVTGGGDISLDGGATNQTIVAALLDTSSTAQGALGGDIQILGDQIQLLGATEINASGDAGGGSVLIGGDYQGKNPEIRNASDTVIDREAVISSNAFIQGDGGKVIVWADNSTEFYGQISATGGIESGDGGFAEVSGRNHLLFDGVADLTAAQGEAGDLLLDPGTVTISTAADSGFDVFNNVTLGTQLDLANVTISTSNATAGPEDINIQAAVNWNSGNSFTLNAGNDINLTGNGQIGNGGNGDLTFNAGNNINIGSGFGGGTVNLNADTDVNNTGRVIIDTALSPIAQDAFINATTALNVTGNGLTLESDGTSGTFVSLQSDALLNVNVTGSVQLIDNCTLGNACTNASQIGIGQGGTGTINAEFVEITSLDGTASMDSFNAAGFSIDTFGANANGYGLQVQNTSNNSLAQFNGAFINGPSNIGPSAGGDLDINTVNAGIGIIDNSSVNQGFASINFGNQDISAQFIEVISNGTGSAQLDSVGQNQIINTNGENNTGQGLVIQTTGAGTAGLSTFDSATETFGDQSITNTGGGSLLLHAQSTGSAFVFGGSIDIVTSFIEVLSDGSGNVDLDSADGGVQTIVTTGANTMGRGLSVISLGSGRAEIDSRLRTIGGGTTTGTTQNISVQNGHDLFVEGQGTGTSGIFGGLQNIVAEDIFVRSNQANAFISSNAVGQTVVSNTINISAVDAQAGIFNDVNLQSITASGINPDGHGISLRVNGTGLASIASDLFNGSNFIGAGQTVNSVSGGIHLESTATSVGGNAQIFGGQQTINAPFIELIGDGENRVSINSSGPLQAIETTGRNQNGQGILLSSNDGSRVQISSFMQGIDSSAGDVNDGNPQIIETNGELIRIASTGGDAPSSFNGIFASTQTINSGGLELNGDAGVGVFIQSEIGDQVINAEYVEVLSRLSNATITNQFGGSQVINTTGQKNGAGISVVSMGPGRARIGSSTGPDGSIFNSPGLDQTVNVANGNALNVNALGTGIAQIYGGQQVLTVGGNLNIGSEFSQGTSAITSTANSTLAIGGDLNLQGGSGVSASASVGPPGVNTDNASGLTLLTANVGGDVNIIGGTGDASFALLHAAGTANITSVGNLNVTGGTGNNAIAGIRADSNNTINIAANIVNLNAGSGVGADAILLSGGGSGAINITANSCNNCGVVFPSTATDQGASGDPININGVVVFQSQQPATMMAATAPVNAAVSSAVAVETGDQAAPTTPESVQEIINSVVSLIATSINLNGDSSGNESDDETGQNNDQSDTSEQENSGNKASTTQCS